jgi:hypothetical protein
LFAKPAINVIRYIALSSRNGRVCLLIRLANLTRQIVKQQGEVLTTEFYHLSESLPNRLSFLGIGKANIETG